jgi:hypothetical protein
MVIYRLNFKIYQRKESFIAMKHIGSFSILMTLVLELVTTYVGVTPQIPNSMFQTCFVSLNIKMANTAFTLDTISFAASYYVPSFMDVSQLNV